MSQYLKELRAKSADIAMKARELFGDESKQAEVEKMLADHDAIEARIAVAQRLDAAERAAEAVAEDKRPLEARSATKVEGRNTKYEAAFTRALRSARELDVPADVRSALDGGYEMRDGQVIGTQGLGGMLVPTVLNDQIIVAEKFYNAMTPDVVSWFDTSTGATLLIPQRDSTGARAKVASEAGAAVANTVTYTDVSVGAYTINSDIFKASWELLQDAAYDIGADLAEHMGESMGRQINDLLTFGSGGGVQPLGILNAINAPVLSSISNAAAVSAGVNAVVPDDITNLEAQVDIAYRKSPKTRLMFNDSTRMLLRQAKDATGRYYWQPAVALGDQDTLFGYSYVVNPSLPSKGTGNTFALFGDFSKFRVRNVRGQFITRFNELYAASRQTGWMMTQRLDAVLVDKRAIAGIKGS